LNSDCVRYSQIGSACELCAPDQRFSFLYLTLVSIFSRIRAQFHSPAYRFSSKSFLGFTHIQPLDVEFLAKHCASSNTTFLTSADVPVAHLRISHPRSNAPYSRQSLLSFMHPHLALHFVKHTSLACHPTKFFLYTVELFCRSSLFPHVSKFNPHVC